MEYPAFFDEVPRVALCDPLAAFLGATKDGSIDYGYIDAVKFAGHSCPTVASAYWMTLLGLRAIFDQDLPIRGGVRVEFSESRSAGANGVMAGVIQMLTGAAGADGFKGLSGIFYRNDLMSFGVSGIRQIRFIQRDSLKSVDVSVDLSRIPMQRDLGSLLKKCLNSCANDQESALFRRMWQERVRRLLLEHGEDRDVFNVTHGRHH